MFIKNRKKLNTRKKVGLARWSSRGVPGGIKFGGVGGVFVMKCEMNTRTACSVLERKAEKDVQGSIQQKERKFKGGIVWGGTEILTSKRRREFLTGKGKKKSELGRELGNT